MEAQVEDEVALEETSGAIRHAPAAEVRMHGEPLEMRDAAALVHALEAHRARAAPLAAVVDLDDEAAERSRVALLLCELLEQCVAVERSARGEVGPHVLVREDAEHEVRVLAGRAADADAVGLVHGS